MPADRKGLKRRRFLEWGLAAGTVGSLVSCGRAGGGPYWRFFTPAEARTVDAICEQIIPADEFAGASQAGVVHFIDLQLTTHYKKHREAYRQGIANLETAAHGRFAKSFADLAEEQQTEVLTAIAEADAGFFTLIRTHTMQGYYGDPRHGGNRNEVSWKMLGLPSPPVRGRVAYEKKTG
jgi:gluconate 2-dehydrogenase gamma chain